MQALGAYGFRGYYEQKSHFLQSIPFALNNLRHLRENKHIEFGLTTLDGVIDGMVADSKFHDQQFEELISNKYHNDSALLIENKIISSESKLTVTIYSFSYKNHVPPPENGNGGGFVFDCRALPNPGRYEEYKLLNGRDLAVINFLKAEPTVGSFLDSVYALIGQSVKVYLERKFTHLMVSFGCTGGQHRSVYCAEQLAKHLKTNFNVTIKLVHLEHP
jgi:RNase adaptor protein for sRNA GlmZ degradation